MADRSSPDKTLLHPARLPRNAPTPFLVEPGPETRAEIAAALGLLGLRKLRFSGELAPMGRVDWHLTGRLGATVVQSCVVTLDPVTTRIDEDVTRAYVSDLPSYAADSETEMPEDDSVDPMPEAIDLIAILTEGLTLALPAYPRASGAELGSAQFAAPGVAPMSDDEVRPFSGLRDLQDKLRDSE